MCQHLLVTRRTRRYRAHPAAAGGRCAASGRRDRRSSYSKSLLSPERQKTLQTKREPAYGLGEELVVVEVDVLVPGDELVLVVFVVLLELELPDGSFSFTTVVSFFSVPGVTVVSFCSHAASMAAPAKIQIIFFIVGL